MKSRPPVVLIVAAVAYLAYLAWQVLADFNPVVAGRFALSAVLFFFVFRGSRSAGNILAVLCAISALVLLVAAVATFSTNAVGAVLFIVIAGLLLAFSAYLFFSAAMRTFQGKVLPASAP